MSEAVRAPAATPYRLFDVTLARKRALSPSLARITFAGPAIRAMKTVAPDQRIKIFFPGDSGRPSALPDRPDWFQIYKAQNAAERAPMRTYTIRHLRADAGELDVDFVLHGPAGPASRWALTAAPGAPVQIAAPNRAYDGDPHGYEWKPPAVLDHVLLIADETALPAAAGILEDLATRTQRPKAQVFLEVPMAADCVPLPRWPGLNITWLPRDRRTPAPHEGALMVEAAARALLPVGPADAPGEALAAIDIDREILWELARPSAGGFYGWVAGESEAVMAIRRLLIRDKGVDRRALNLMGYWRRGRALDDGS